jgi:hypothetical protein
LQQLHPLLLLLLLLPPATRLLQLTKKSHERTATPYLW